MNYHKDICKRQILGRFLEDITTVSSLSGLNDACMNKWKKNSSEKCCMSIHMSSKAGTGLDALIDSQPSQRMNGGSKTRRRNDTVTTVAHRRLLPFSGKNRLFSTSLYYIASVCSRGFNTGSAFTKTFFCTLY